MSRISKKFFYFLPKKKIFLFLSVFVSLGFLFLPSSASAGIWEALKSLPLTIPSAMVAVVFWILASLASMLATLSNVILCWVLSPSFTELPYTKPGPLPDGNPIIEAGLGITQGFVNMFLVLILVYIALATILRLGGRETQKLLVTFIVVALLVNFAPVICGIIVDASNIFMNATIKGVREAGGATLLNRLSQTKDVFSAGFLDAMFNFKLMAGKIMQLLVITIANLALFLVLLLFAVIFMARYIVIWLLVILSPLAFACYILPITKKYWTMWWNQFIQWSIIGMTCGFFLYLGMLLANLDSKAFGTPQGFATTVLPYFVPIAFLMIGLVFGLQTSAMGASTIMSLTKRGGKWVGRSVARRGIKPRLEQVRAKEAVGAISRTVEKVPGARWFLPEAMRKYGQMRPAIEEAQARAKPYSSQTLGHRILKKADTQTDATGDLIEILARGDAQDVFEAAKRLEKWKGKSDQDILEDKEFNKIMGRPLDIANKGGILNSGVLRRDPRLAKVAAAQGIEGYKGYSAQKAVTKAVSQARSQHISTWEPETFKDKNVITATLGQFDRDRWLQINRTIKNGQRESLKGIDETFTEFVDSKKLDPTRQEENWEEFREYIKEKNQGQEGYFKALKEKRIINTGWRPGEYLTKDKREGKAPPPTPGEAVGIPKPPPPGAPKRPPKPSAGAPKRPPKPSAGAPKRSGIPFVITRKMREALRKKGYTDKDINKMKPKEAWEILGISP